MDSNTSYGRQGDMQSTYRGGRHAGQSSDE